MYVTFFIGANKLYITIAYITIARSKSVQKLDGMTKLTGVNSYVSKSYVQRVALQDFAGPQAASPQQ